MGLFSSLDNFLENHKQERAEKIAQDNAPKVQQQWDNYNKTTQQNVNTMRDVTSHTMEERQNEAYNYAAGYNYESRTQAEADIWNKYQFDSVARNAAYSALDKRYNTIGDKLWDPYGGATTQKYIDQLFKELKRAGKGDLIPADGKITGEWLNSMAWLNGYRRESDTTQTAQAPKAGTKAKKYTDASSPLQNSAYWYQKVFDAEDRTQKAEAAWSAMQTEAKYWAGRGLSDAEILNKLNSNKDYKALFDADTAKTHGEFVEYNRGIGYSQDAIKGVIWAARNGSDTTDYLNAAVRGQLGQGKGYIANVREENKRNPASPDYAPYSGGSTMHDVNMYIGQTSYDRSWIDAHLSWQNDGDAQHAKIFKSVYDAVAFSDEAASELKNVKDNINALFAAGASKEDVRKWVDDVFAKESDTTLNVTNLRKMETDTSVSWLKQYNGIANTGYDIGYNGIKDIYAYIDNASRAGNAPVSRTQVADVATGKAAVSAAVAASDESVKSATANGGKKRNSIDIGGAVGGALGAIAGFFEPFFNPAPASDRLKEQQDEWDKANGNVPTQEATPTQETPKKVIDENERIVDKNGTEWYFDPSSAMWTDGNGNFEPNRPAGDVVINEEPDVVSGAAPSVAKPNTPTQEAAPAQETPKEPVKKAPEVSLDQAMEAAVAQRDAMSKEAQALFDERSKAIEELNYFHRASSMTGGNTFTYDYAGEYEMLLNKVNDLTAKIGDGYQYTTDYTNADLRSILGKAFSGEALTPEESSKFITWYNGTDGKYLLGQYMMGNMENNSVASYNVTAERLGTTAATAMQYVDSADANNTDRANVVMELWEDMQSAEASGMNLEDWYAANPREKAQLEALSKGAVESNIAAKNADNEKIKAERREAIINAGIGVQQKLTSGQELTEDEKNLYTALSSGEADTNDPTVKSIRSDIVSTFEAYGQDKYSLGSNDVYQRMMKYIDADYTLAQAAGITLEELYAAHPELRKSTDTLFQMANNDFVRTWGDDGTEEYRQSLDVATAVTKLAQDVGYGWLNDKIHLGMVWTDRDDGYVIGENAMNYVHEYGIANARYNYRADAGYYIANMSDDNPDKARLQALLDEADANGMDIFRVPLNIPYENLKDAHSKYAAKIEENHQYIMEHGTPMENFIFTNVEGAMSNGIKIAESAAIGALTGGSPIGTFAAFGLSGGADAYFDARENNGADRAHALMYGIASAVTTTALENPLIEQYLPGDAYKSGIKNATAWAANGNGPAWLKKGLNLLNGKGLIAGAVNYGMDVASEGVQEVVENYAQGGLKLGFFGDASGLQEAYNSGWETFYTASFQSMLMKLPSQAVNLHSETVAEKQEALARSEKLRKDLAEAEEAKQKAQVTPASETTDPAAETPAPVAEAPTTPTQEAPTVIPDDPDLVQKAANDATGVNDSVIGDGGLDAAVTDANGINEQVIRNIEEKEQKAANLAEAEQTIDNLQNVMGNEESRNELEESIAAEREKLLIGNGGLDTDEVKAAQQRVDDAESAYADAKKKADNAGRAFRRARDAAKAAANPDAASTEEGAKKVAETANRYKQAEQAYNAAKAERDKAKSERDNAVAERNAAKDNAFASVREQARQYAHDVCANADATLAQGKADIQQQKADNDAELANDKLEMAENKVEMAKDLFAETFGTHDINSVDRKTLDGKEAVVYDNYVNALRDLRNAKNGVAQNAPATAPVEQNAPVSAEQTAPATAETVQPTQNAPQDATTPDNAPVAPSVNNPAPVQQNAPAANINAQSVRNVPDTNPLAGSSGDTDIQKQRQFGKVDGTKDHTNILHEATKRYLEANSAYMTDTNKAQLQRAGEFIEKNFKNVSEAVRHFTDPANMAFYNSPDGVAAANLMMAECSSMVDYYSDKESSHYDEEKAQMYAGLEADVAQHYNILGTTAGQTLQARNIFNMMSGRGTEIALERVVREYNTQFSKQGLNLKVDPEVLAKIRNAKTAEERMNIVDAEAKRLAKQIPTTLQRSVDSWRMLSMLGNPKTHIRNLLGNAAFVPLDAISNVIATGLERTLGKVGAFKVDHNEHSVIVGKNYRDFAKYDSKLDRTKDRLGGGTKYDDSVSSKNRIKNIMEEERRRFPKGFGALEAVAKGNGWLLGQEDAIFKGLHYRNALASYLQSNNISVEQITDENGKTTWKVDPDALALAQEHAFRMALRNTYNDTNAFVEAFQNSNPGNGVTKGVKKAVKLWTDAVLPFKNTPANVLARGIDYSPLGLLGTAFKGTYDLMNGKIDANQYINNLSANITGTGAFLLGAVLGNAGILNPSPDDEDKFMGIQQNSINIGIGDDTYNMTIDWLTPAAFPLFMGANFSKLVSEFTGGTLDLNDWTSAGASIIEPIVELSCVDSAANLFDISNYSNSDTKETIALNQLFVKPVTSYVGQFIPTFSGQVVRSIYGARMKNYVLTNGDNSTVSTLKYEASKLMNKSLIWCCMRAMGAVDPGSKYVDQYGEYSASADDGFIKNFLYNAFSPAYINEVRDDELSTFIDGIAGDLKEPYVPSTPSRYYNNYSGEKVYLDAHEYEDLSKAVGSTYKTLSDQLIKDDGFLRLDIQHQVEALEKIEGYANAKAMYDMFPDSKSDTYDAWVTEKDNDSYAITQAVKDATEDMNNAPLKQGKAELKSAVGMVSGKNMTAHANDVKWMEEAQNDIYLACSRIALAYGADKKAARNAINNYVRKTYKDSTEDGRNVIMNALLRTNVGYDATTIMRWAND